MSDESILYFAIIGFLIVLSITLYSSVIWVVGVITEDIAKTQVAPMFFLGIVGFGLLGLSLLVMYKEETQMSHSMWRLAEKTLFTSGFFLLLVVWFFLGFIGNPGFELLYSYSIPLIILGSLLSAAGFISWTERRRKPS